MTFFNKCFKTGKDATEPIGRLKLGDYPGRLFIDPKKGLILLIEKEAVDSGNIIFYSIDDDSYPGISD